VYIVGGAVVSNPANALRGTVVLAAGVPVYLFWSRRLRGREARMA
jgi:APA family basic amino acid/polyamine antiporter